MPKIDPPLLRLLLRYDPETGLLYWRRRSREYFKSTKGFATWNGKNADREAFTATDNKGYRQGTIIGSHYRAHRVVWAITHGVFPQEQIDHINGDPADNRIANLRLVEPAANQRNMKRSATNKSGCTGVERFRSKWRARITVNRAEIHLGTFDSFADAVAARKTAEQLHGFHKNHGR